MRIHAITPVWQRHDLTARFYRAFNAIQVPAGWELALTIGGSEGSRSQRPAENAGARYVELPNRPLGAKFQGCLDSALESEWDYVWVLGSDTFCTPGILDMFRPHLDEGCERIGLRDLWLYRIVERDAWYWPGYGKNRDDSIGAGRFVHRNTVERAGGKLWPSVDYGLDYAMSKALDALGTRERLLYHATMGELLFEARGPEQVTNTDALLVKATRFDPHPVMVSYCG